MKRYSDYTRLVITIMILPLLGGVIYLFITATSANKSTRSSTTQTFTQDNIMNGSPNDSFDSRLSAYLAEPDYARRCDIAKYAASTQPDLLRLCARRMLNVVDTSKQQAISHFATRYYQLGGKQSEIVQLLQSGDVDLVDGLLSLLCSAVEIDGNGTWQLDRPLGGPEMPSHVARVAISHPELSSSVASTLGKYGQGIYNKQTKKEMRTLLTMLLSQDEQLSRSAYFAILMIDDALCVRFGLGLDPLTEQQKNAIADYIKSLH